MCSAQAIGPPHFIGVGAQRSGTTWWFSCLIQHPGIRGPRNGHKEQHFFNRFVRAGMTRRDAERYYRRFPRLPGELVGEWTPRYMHDFWTPRLIRRVAPKAKLLVMLRDPIDRFSSGVPKEATFGRNRAPEWVVADAVERGRYATQLRRLRMQHPTAQVLVLQYERCRIDPAGQYRRTLQFLGADSGAPMPDFERPVGWSSAKQTTRPWPDLREALLATFEPEARALSMAEPAIDLSLWPNFAHLAPATSDAAPA